MYIPFGLKNAAATFQQFIDNVLEDMNNAIAYVDNIIVFSKTLEEHIKHLNELFGRLKRFGVVINPTKSQLGISELQFLDHFVTKKGIKPLSSKVEAIQKYPLPKND